MKLDQVSARYLQEQDRILVRMNTSSSDELRFWLTRRMCLRLWPNLRTIAADRITLDPDSSAMPRSATATYDGATRKMLADFQRQEILKTADFKTPYREQPLQFPLGADPLVVTEISLTNLPDGRLQLEFSEKLPDTDTHRSFQASLENSNLHGFMHLLENALEQSGWLGDSREAPGEAAATTPHQRPQYLN